MTTSLRKVFDGDIGPLITRMRGRLPMTALNEVASNLKISPGNLLEVLRLSRDTVADDDKLSALAQDRLFRAEDVLFCAIDVMEDEDAAREWLVSEIPALGRERPLTLLDTEVGYELVLNTIRQIRYGIYA